MGDLQEPCGYCKKEHIFDPFSFLDIPFYSSCIVLLTIIIFLIKDKKFKGMEEKKSFPSADAWIADFDGKDFLKKSLCFDKFYISIVSFLFIYFLYDSNRGETTTCEYFHNCHGGRNDTLFAESYWFETKGSCPSDSELTDSFFERHQNGRVEMRYLPWLGYIGSACVDIPYGCFYISTLCDTLMGRQGSSYSEFQRGEDFRRENIHFSEINTKITKKDEIGSNCPQYNTLIMDYLIRSRGEDILFAIILIVDYIIINIALYIYIYKNGKDREYGQLDGATMRGSA